MRKWILVAIGVVLGIVALVLVVGVLLPEGHVATARATYARSPDEIWSALTDVENAPEWRSGVDRVERLPDRDGRTTWRETGRFGATTFELVEAQPPRRLVARIADPDLPYGGTWTYVVEPVDDGATRLTITEDGEIHNPFYRFMARFVFGYHATMETYLQDLGRRFGVDEIEVVRVR